jgi:preprotein translocase subunit SecG
MLTFLLVIQAIVAILLVGVILMQQSEGGGLGMGGSPTGLMSARGAADFLTRATTILAAIFIALSILHAVLATQHNRGGDIDTSLAKTVTPAAPAPSVPIGGAPAPAPTGEPALAPTPAPATTAVPIATVRPKVEQRTERPQRTSATSTSAAPPPVTKTVAPASSTPAPAPTNSN